MVTTGMDRTRTLNYPLHLLRVHLRWGICICLPTTTYEVSGSISFLSTGGLCRGASLAVYLATGPGSMVVMALLWVLLWPYLEVVPFPVCCGDSVNSI